MKLFEAKASFCMASRCCIKEVTLHRVNVSDPKKKRKKCCATGIEWSGYFCAHRNFGIICVHSQEKGIISHFLFEQVKRHKMNIDDLAYGVGNEGLMYHVQGPHESRATGISTVSVVIEDVSGVVDGRPPLQRIWGSAEQMTRDEREELSDTLFALRDLVDQALVNVRNVLVRTQTDEFAVRVEAETITGDVRNFYVNFVPYASMTGDMILNAIEKALNSSEAIEIPFTIWITRRSRVVLDLFQVNGRRKWNPELLEYVKKKRGIVSIEDGNDCFAQFVALGIAHMIQLGKLNPLPELDLIHPDQDYKRMVNNICFRRRVGEKIVQRINGIQEPDWDIAVKVRELFGVQVVLYSFNERNTRVYPDSSEIPRRQANHPVICGLLSRQSNETVFTHVDYVAKPTSVVDEVSESPRFCQFCYEVYKRKRVCNNAECGENKSSRCHKCHTCAGLCDACKTPDCGRMSFSSQRDVCFTHAEEPFSRRTACTACSTVLFSPLCQERHVDICSIMKSRKCPECNSAFHGGRACDEERCIMCKAKIKVSDAEDHVCFMKRMVMKNDTKSHYWVYDFETLVDHDKTTDRSVLKLYLATVWPIEPNEAAYRLGKMDRYNANSFIFPDYGERQPVFVFWGLGNEEKVEEGVYDFFHFVSEKMLDGAQFFAHNAGRFDAIFVERYLAKMGRLSNTIRRGQKIIQLHYADNNVSFKDSINFIPSSLRSMSSAFGIDELRKGFFPHRLMTKEYFLSAKAQGYKVPKPPREVFRHDFRNNADGKAEQKELSTFLEEFYADPEELWDIRKDAIDYCISDTVLLGKVLEQFRSSTQALSDPIPRPPDVEFVSFDPLQFMTLPGGVMRFYMSQFLPENTGYVLDGFKWKTRIEQQLATLYTAHCSKIPYEIKDDPVQRAGEQFYSGRAEVDGKVHFFVFQDCYLTGCDTCHAGYGLNLRTGRLFYNSIMKTEERLNQLRLQHLGADIYVLTSHDWMKIKSTEAFQKWMEENELWIQSQLGCDPRDAYKGGVSECYKLFVDLPHRMQVSDFVSQYPMVLIGESYHPLTGAKRKWDMPIGQPRILYRPQDYQFNPEILGIIKCRVLAPQNMYAPFLSFKVPSAISPGDSKETLYGVCRECMRTRNWESCEHNDQDRSFIGTWTLGEIYFARDHGYQILDVIEVWEYPGRTNTLFRDFIIPFMIAKTCCKKGGLVENDTFTARGVEVCEYIREVTGRVLSPHDFRDAPAQRTVAKLIQNVLYGKLAQRSLWPETQLFRDEDDKSTRDCLRLFYDTNIDVKYAEVVDDFTSVEGPKLIIVVEYEKKSPSSRGDAGKNDIWAAHVTAGGRQALFEGIWSLTSTDPNFPSPNYMIYCDTDSLDHVIPPQLPYKTGFRIGDLEPEVTDAYYFVGGGRKQYMYKLPDGKVVCKQKGVDIRMSMATQFTPENLLSLIRNTKRKWDEYQQEQEEENAEESHHDQLVKRMRVDAGTQQSFPQILVDETRLVTVPENRVVRNKEERVIPKKTMFHLWALKRVVRWDGEQRSGILDTLPFGYKANHST